MSEAKTVLDGEQMVWKSDREEGAADFSTDAGALIYANRQLDRLVSAMRYSLEKQIVGWPLDERDRELNTYEALRHLLRNISFGHATYVEGDYDNPTLTKMGGMNRIQFQLQSPDCNYHAAVLHSDYRYRLRGYRGTSAIFQAQVASGHGCNPGEGWRMFSLANNFDTPALAPGKTVDVVLSRDKPADLGGAHWLQLPQGRCELHLRQYYADWETEEPAELILTHEGQSFPSQLLVRETSEERFERLVELVRVHANFYRAGVQGHLDANPDEIEELVIPGAFAGVNYFFGHFHCRPDQAVIVDLDRPQSLYWNVALNQMQWEPGDYWAKLVSYTMRQVQPEPDGRVRWIASWTDPGVPNWLDCSGRVLHLIAFRFFRSDIKQPNPRLKTVPLSDVANYMTAGAPSVTPSERQALMTRRLVSVHRRRFNDF